jgi:hypothetical protein
MYPLGFEPIPENITKSISHTAKNCCRTSGKKSHSKTHVHDFGDFLGTETMAQ